MQRTTHAIALAVVASLILSGQAFAVDSAEKRIQRLEQQLGQALKQIDELKKEVKQQKAVGTATAKQVEQNDLAQKETEKKVATPAALLPDWLKKVSLFGDVRIRHEGFYHQPGPTKGATITARNRERFRARVGVNVNYSDELSGTVRAATGNPNDPISTNEDMGKVFNRKNWNLDQAFITFKPGQSFNMRPGALALIAGKQPLPFFRVGEMVWDDDLTPEGFSETYALLDKPWDVFDQVKFHAYQWTFSEVSNNQDGWIVGGQINPTMTLGPAQIELGLAHSWYLNPDLIADALNPKSKNFNSALKNSNLTVPDGSTIAYKSGFSLSNETLAVTFPDVVCNQPLKIFQDYVYNWEAATSDSYGIQGGLKLGQTKKRGDWAATALYEYLGQESALSSFAYSDFGPVGGTNVEGPIISLDYQLLDPLTVSAKSSFTNSINRTSGQRNPTTTRLMLDAMIKF